MRKTYNYIATALVLVLAASCNKIDSSLTGESHIRFAPQSIGTKATVDVKADLQAQTFAVVGLLDGVSNFQNTIAYSGGSWDYGTTPANYVWKNGTHKFYAYTNGAGTLSSNKLTVDKTLTTSDDPMSDLLYSKVFESTAAAWKSSHQALDPVPLYFQHMLSAVSIVIKNCTENAVTIQSVSAPAIPNKSTATVDFTTVDTDKVPAVSYGSVTADRSFVTATPISEASIALSENEMIDVLKMAKVATSETAGSYHVVWPQTIAEDAVTITLSYTMTSEEETKTYTDVTVPLPTDTWTANNKYEYVLQILPTDVRLKFTVQPWEEVPVSDVDNTKDHSINMTNVTWQNTKVSLTQGGDEVNTLDIAGYSVYMYKDPYVNGVKYNGYFPAQGYFTVNYPMNGLFRIGLIAAYGETDVDTTKYQIKIYRGKEKGFELIDPDGEPITNETVYFQICANPDEQDGYQYKAQIDIWFKPDGSDEWISAYSEIRANYACIIPATN